MSKFLSAKLRRARENLGLTQEALAKAVGLSSEFISNLESGKKLPSLGSLQRLAGYLKKEISYFLEEKEAAFEILFREKEGQKETRAALLNFKKFCEDYLWLEKETKCRSEIAPIYTRSSPKKLAEEERLRMGLGNAVIREVFSLLEQNGLHIYRYPLPPEAKISGIFVYLEEDETSFALIDSLLPFAQQTLIACHEYCHFLKDRFSGPIIDNPDILIDEYLSLYHPRERFAQEFALFFLLPFDNLREVIEKDIQRKNLEFEDMVYLKNYFGVDFGLIISALKKFNFLSASKSREIERLIGSKYEEFFYEDSSLDRNLKRKKRRGIPSERFKRLAIHAYRKKMITLDKLSKLMGTKVEKIKPFFPEGKITF